MEFSLPNSSKTLKQGEIYQPGSFSLLNISIRHNDTVYTAFAV